MKTLPLTYVLLLLAAAPLRVAAQESPTGVVLLATGQLLQGTVTDEGEQALITLGPGSQMRLPHQQIVCVGRSIEEIFEFQYRRLDSRDVAGRIHLARWCMRSELPAAAGRLLVELVELAPNDARIDSLEQQLRQHVRSTPQATSTAHEPTKPADNEWTTVAEMLSPAAFDRYTRQVQPLIINHCSASGCHGVASKSTFQLLRPLTGVKLTQRMTQRNLYAVLAQVERETPLESPIWAAATKPHASFAAPLFSEQTDREQIEALRVWLESLSASVAKPATPVALPTTNAVLLQPLHHSPPLPPTTGGAKQEPHAIELNTAPNLRSAREAEEFNRRYFPQGPKPPATASP